MKTKNQKPRTKNLLSLIFYLLSKNGGQIVLVLVLVTVVGLTIGLSLVSRSITDVRISSQLEQSSRAFSAAEAGIESALKGAVIGGPTGTVSLPGASANYTVTSLGGAGSPYYLPVTGEGASQTVWLVAHNSDGTINEGGSSYPADSSIDICWGSKASDEPAVIVTLVYKDGSTYKIAKGAYDSNGTRGNNFTVITDTAGGYCGSNFRFRKTVTPTTDFGINPTVELLAIRLQPVYESSAMAVNPAASQTLPLQGRVITSVGQTGTGVVRKVQVTEYYQALPALLDFALFSEN